MPVVAKKQAPKKALNKRAQRKKSLKKKVPDGDILPRAKVGGKLPPRLKHPMMVDSPVKAKNNVKPEEMWPERRCQSPVQILPMEAPVFVKGTELGLPELSRRVGDQSSHRLPKIYIGAASPTPRWMIRQAGPEAGQNISPRSSVSSSTRLPELGRLRWEFDPGPPATHGQDESRLRDYAYQYLLNSLNDPIVRDEVREMIWGSFYAPTVAHVEDPLPIPPPPPHFKDQRPSDYVNLRPPISASNPDDYHFMYPDYERPSLAARAYQSNYTPAISYGSRGSNGSYTSTRSSIGESTHTSSSVSTNPKDYVPEYHDVLSDDNTHHFGPSEYKWIWIVLTVLILAMFLCLFLYAFGILE
ncbi:hypothetical protein ASPVEDRAFT_559258 [Aspergillus versicolor CBS 583.65]|uniref:Uncharacterized protein n=1 Tax=Aspergillus versicolor CBS 583.65 TaxID=1036611 RepID=A0A1L9PFM9_ASPVE|nr:uncharacterized protein ASPVEDRAFT_559258 [Aspergillus versicolor CBS 583.65]OJJ00310.1 hypothetical protein ASPVEDRAFT_559258 [Aspergillus versicolor CBS 583.65]